MVNKSEQRNEEDAVGTSTQPRNETVNIAKVEALDEEGGPSLMGVKEQIGADSEKYAEQPDLKVYGGPKANNDLIEYQSPE